MEMTNIDLSHFANSFKNIYNLVGPIAIFEGRFRLEISSDNLGEFLDSDNSSKQYYHIDFYDDSDIIKENYHLLQKFMGFLRSQHNCYITLIISHKDIPSYCDIIRKFFNETQLAFLDINMINEFDSSVKDFNVDLPCRLSIPSTMINYISLDTLERNLNYISSNYKNTVAKQDILALKKFTQEFAEDIRRKYNFAELNDFEKSKLVYDYIIENIEYADEAVYFENGRSYLKNDPEYSYVTVPYRTLINKRGICSGQSWLMEAMLSNSDIDVQARVALGLTPSKTAHAWVETIIDEKIYTNCLTTFSFCVSLEELGYILRPNRGVKDLGCRFYDLPRYYLTFTEQLKINEGIERKLKR